MRNNTLTTAKSASYLGNAGIILFALWLYAQVFDENKFSIELILGVFSTLSIFFFSTFLTSIWTWAYILSTWSIRMISSKLLDGRGITSKPENAVPIFVGFWVFLGTLLIAVPMQENEMGVSAYDNMLCSFSGEVCHRLSKMSDNEKAAIMYLTYACRDGVAVVECFSEAFSAFGVDPQRTVAFFDASCEGGEPIGCTNLGVMYLDGIGVDADPVRAAELFSQACDQGNTQGCYNLGVMYRDGIGVDADPVRAAELFSQACDQGDTQGCYNLGVMYRDGIGIDADPVRAAELFSQVCDQGDVRGCFNLAAIYRDDNDAKTDPEQALDRFRQACMEDPEPCSKLKFSVIESN